MNKLRILGFVLVIQFLVMFSVLVSSWFLKGNSSVPIMICCIYVIATFGFLPLSHKKISTKGHSYLYYIATLIILSLLIAGILIDKNLINFAFISIIIFNLITYVFITKDLEREIIGSDFTGKILGKTIALIAFSLTIIIIKAVNSDDILIANIITFNLSILLLIDSRRIMGLFYVKYNSKYNCFGDASNYANNTNK